VDEGDNTQIPYGLQPWAFNGKTRQWYAMKPLCRSNAPVGVSPYTGFGGNYVFATEYGLMLLLPIFSQRVYSYSPYSNQWTLLPRLASDSAFPGLQNDPCVAYDNKHHKAVTFNCNSAAPVYTFAYDVGTHSWSRVNSATQPTPTNLSDQVVGGWYNAYGASTYDRKNGVVVYLTYDGAETWTLDLDSAKWRNMSPTGTPSSNGNMGEGMAFDPKRNATLVYANRRDEVWTYKYGAGIPDRPDPVADPSGVTDANSITLAWTAPPAGSAPVKYYVYRSQWEDNRTTASGLVPGPYVKIDSATALTYRDTAAILKTAGVFHSYAISAVSAQGVESDLSSPVFTRLRVPMGLVATPFSKTRVLLRWVPKKEADVAGYNIYRTQKAYPTHTMLKGLKINSSPVTGLTYFIDTTLSLCSAAVCPDSMAMYAITAVNSLGKESGFSPYALTVPDQVPNLWADTVNKRITWSPPRNGKIVNYRIFDGRVGDWNTGSANPTQVATVTDTFWSYAGRNASAYKVRAFNDCGQVGHFSDVMEIQTKDNDNFGMLRVDFQAHRPEVDSFYDGLPSLGVAIEDALLRLSGAAFSVAVSPNPFSGVARISVSGPAQKARVTMKVHDMAGRLVKEMSGTSGAPISFEALHLATGIYHARIQCGKNVRTVKMIVIK